MTWTYVMIVALLFIICILVIAKLYLKRKLQNIDGFGRITKADEHTNVIASFGDMEDSDEKNV